MKFLFLFLLITFSLDSKANYPFLNFSKNNIKLSKYNFQRYIKPQVKQIIDEFFFLLKKQDPVHHHLIALNDNISLVMNKWNLLIPKCQSTYKNEDCKYKLKLIYTKLKNIENSIFKLYANQSIAKRNTQTDNYLLFLTHLTTLSNSVYFISQQIEIEIISSNHSSLSIKDESDISSELNNVKKITNQLITIFVQQNMNKHFSELWNEFIYVLKKNVLKTNSKNYLIDRLGELNSSWNIFHMNLLKSNIATNRHMTNSILIMHNRWNNILKIILDSHKDRN